MICQIDDAISMTDQRRGITRDEMPAPSNAHDQRTAQAGCNQQIGMITKQHRDPIGSADLTHSPLNRRDTSGCCIFAITWANLVQSLGD